MPIVASLARATLLEAVRNRLLWLAVVVVVIAFGLAQFLNQVAITESREIQTALLAAPLRVAAVFILAVFVITSMVRELGDKVTELLLSLPAPRSAYFFGKFAGHAVVAAILALLSALPLVLFANSQGLVLWTISLICEQHQRQRAEQREDGGDHGMAGKLSEKIGRARRRQGEQQLGQLGAQLPHHARAQEQRQDEARRKP